MFGILLVDKPEGISSHDVVNRIRRRFQTRRVGHAGTLDPLATGALVVAVGPATRFLQYLPLEPKEYVGTVTFGVTTSTLDREGQVLQEMPVPSNLGGLLADAIPKFLGLIEQVPPMFSAIKKDGKPLYELARMGKTVERRARRVHIDAFEVTALAPPNAEVRVVCSGGTYIRTLADDLGKALGCGAYLSSLRRTRVGRFGIERAVSLDDACPEHLIPLSDALSPMPMLDLTEHQVADIRMGRALKVNGHYPEDGLVSLVGQGSIVGVARSRECFLYPECVIPAEACL